MRYSYRPELVLAAVAFAAISGCGPTDTPPAAPSSAPAAPAGKGGAPAGATPEVKKPYEIKG